MKKLIENTTFFMMWATFSAFVVMIATPYLYVNGSCSAFVFLVLLWVVVLFPVAVAVAVAKKCAVGKVTSEERQQIADAKIAVNFRAVNFRAVECCRYCVSYKSGYCSRDTGFKIEGASWYACNEFKTKIEFRK